jgi:raffinose/stachyose/melibiose transport system permease protein
MAGKRTFSSKLIEALIILSTVVLHWIPYYFILNNASKNQIDAAKLDLALPTEFALWENVEHVLTFSKGLFLKSFWISVRLTIFSIGILVIVSSMTAYILQRKRTGIAKASDKLILAGLIVPASVIPTYWVLNLLGVANTLPGLILVEVALLFPFAVMMYKGFIANLPRELDEAAVIDGCGPFRLFWKIIFPMTKPITMTVVILRSIVVYNDYQNPQYFMSGAQTQTVQLCVYVFKSSFTAHNGHLMAAVIVVSLPLLIMFLFLNKYMMEGMTAGAVKG